VLVASCVLSACSPDGRGNGDVDGGGNRGGGPGGPGGPGGDDSSGPESSGPIVSDRTGLRFLAEGDGDDAFARALTPRAFEFPRDHGAHNEYRSEWWYFTGNLETADARHFGFELTFFRFALDAAAPERASEWGTSQAWMAHFALTDTQAGDFMAAERFARGALGLAGAEAAPFRVWVEDWSADARTAAGGDGDAFAARLEARDGGYALDLELVAMKEPVANGEDGLDRKGSGAGNASYYYSISRLSAQGTVTTPQGRFAVEGSAWLDREWGTSALEDGAVGWDWFALQLDDGRDLMFYRLRRADGSAIPYSGGSLIGADGSRRALAADDVRLEPTATWTSRASGVRYPVAWRLGIPSLDIELAVTPYLENQELDLTVRYWEGAVRARGTAGGAPVGGRGYLELAGY
jgi:predicted secreted hydrolase